MNVSLTPKLEAYVRAKVEGGLYRSSSEVVREALRLLQQSERLQERSPNHPDHESTATMDAGMKTIGSHTLSYRERFDRLQRTAHRLLGGMRYPKGVYKFSTFEELEAWKMSHILGRRNPRTKETW